MSKFNEQSRFVRIPKAGFFGGVAAGIAYFFGINVQLVRLGWVVFTLLGGSGTLFYILLWIFVPGAPDVPEDFKERANQEA